jgi:THO complex subunit 7
LWEHVITFLRLLQEKSQKLNEQLELRRKQFHVLIASIHQLEALLESSEGSSNDALDVFDDEDMDILSGKTEQDQMDTS